MTNNDHRRTAYTMTNKQNEQQDKRSQKDSLHNDQKQNEKHDKQRSQKDNLHNDQQTK
jgi:hypothetical protein